MGLVIRQSSKGLLVTIIGTIIGFFNITWVFPRFLTPEQIGITRFLPEFAMVISSFTMLGMNHSMIRFYPRVSKEFASNSFGFWSFLVPSLGFLIFSVIWYFNHDWINSLFSEKAELLTAYFYLILPLLLLIVMISVTETFSAILGRITVPKLNKEVLFRLAILFLAVLLGLEWMNFSQFLLAFVLLHAIHLIANFAYLRSLGPLGFSSPGVRNFDGKLFREYISFTLLILSSSFASIVLPRLDFIMISSMEGMADTGIYALAFTIAMVIAIPRRVIEQISSPIISKRMFEKDYNELLKLYKESALNQTILGAIIFLGLWVNLDAIFYLMPNGKVYEVGKVVFFILGIGKLIELSSGPGNHIIANSSFFKYSILMGIITTVLAIGLNMWLIPDFGINGAAMATVISYVMLSIYTIAIVYYKLRILPFDAKMLFLFLILASLLVIHHWFNFNFIPFLPLKIVVQSASYMFLFIGLIYTLNISPSLNKVATKYLRQILNKWLK